eukprot:TRINITY_DN903_c0_g1_i1.p1 TRINITY_DN903_c0_g1~~TRINITY_DN903_c0_g1_i1.p1  ORF type:complete len:588 (-),score=61.67 TRINITY_DN903_c0_g1_i1:342-2105(-)
MTITFAVLQISSLLFLSILEIAHAQTVGIPSELALDEMECPETFWTEIEKGCEEGEDTSADLRGRFRVFEGQETEVERWPYLISLQRRLSGPFRGCYLHRCGATLIAPDLVLTAAHCLWSPSHDYRHTSIPNILGVELYAALGPRCRHQQGLRRIKVIRYFISDDYVAESQTRGGGDIAVLQLEQPFEEGMLANLSQQQDSLLEKNQLTVVGWGDTESDDASYAIRKLRMGTLKYVSDSICEAIMSAVSDGRLTVHKDREVCAYNSDIDSCDGDSGGPLLLADSEGDPTEDVQVGIVSWGPPGACGQSNRQLVGVYTSVSHYLPWIEQIKQEVAILPSQAPVELAIEEPVTNSPDIAVSVDSKCLNTKNGCKCEKVWTFNSNKVQSGCTNPDGDLGGAWCIIVPDSCPPDVNPAGNLTLNFNPTGSQYDYCEEQCSPPYVEEKEVDDECAITVMGCSCKDTWEVSDKIGETYTGCANPDEDPRGSWCHYEDNTCIANPAGRGWDYCKPGCGLGQLKQGEDLTYTKEINKEFRQQARCTCTDNPDSIMHEYTCLDVKKLGLCLEKTYAEQCRCTCGTCSPSKEVNQGG